jgi:hypothetical protein
LFVRRYAEIGNEGNVNHSFRALMLAEARKGAFAGSMQEDRFNATLKSENSTVLFCARDGIQPR